jgi:hypothetical protein
MEEDPSERVDILDSFVRPELDPHDVAGIPCYFDEFSAQAVRWGCEAKHLLALIAYIREVLRKQAERRRLLDLTRKRLLAFADAYVEHDRALTELLAPLAPERVGVYDYFLYFTRNGARSSELTTHYANLHRDWSWGIDETQRTFELLESLLPKRPLGRVLALGAGACRLPYDLHRAHRPDVTVVTDINPLLFFAARRIVAGEELELYEFPLLPVDIDSCAVKRKLRAPAAVDDRFRFVLTDATRPCFKPGSFDTIFTSWFIDATPMDVHELFPMINRLLDRNGIWMNVGPLMYKSHLPRLYSAEETVAIAEKAGFVVQASTREFVPYLQSPADCHRRIEGVVAFRAKKVDDADSLAPPSSETAPERPVWMSDPSRPVELGGDLQSMISAHIIAAKVLSSIDGNSGIDRIVDRIAEDLDLPRPVIETAVKRYLFAFVAGYTGNPMLANG